MRPFSFSSFSPGQWAVFLFSILYVAGFTAYYLSIGNFEFLWYVVVMLIFFGLIATTLHRSGFGLGLLWALSFWGLLHVAGGGVRVGGEVLYAYHLLPLFGSGELFVLKYDQLVHVYGFAVATWVVWHLLRPYLGQGARYAVIYPIVVAAGMGLGALNEIVEFTAVLVFPETGVGGYFNTGLDLVFNMLGAVVAVVIIHFRTRVSKNPGLKILPKPE